MFNYSVSQARSSSQNSPIAHWPRKMFETRLRECLMARNESSPEEYINRCDVCRTFDLSQQKEKLHLNEAPDKLWSKVAVDLFEFSNRHYLVTVDYYSNFWYVDRMESSTTSKAVMSKLKQHFQGHVIPDKVVSDNGPQFDSDDFVNFSREWEFDHVTSSPGHAQFKALEESAVKTVKRLIRKAHEDE